MIIALNALIYTLDEDIHQTKQAGDINKISPIVAANVVTGGGDDRAVPEHQTVHKDLVTERAETEPKATESGGVVPLHVVTKPKVTLALATEEKQITPTTIPPNL